VLVTYRFTTCFVRPQSGQKLTLRKPAPVWPCAEMELKNTIFTGKIFKRINVLRKIDFSEIHLNLLENKLLQ
jgi:hypothetical protein